MKRVFLRSGWSRLFKTLRGDGKEDIEFMDEVDAALHRKPFVGPVLLSLGTAGFIALFVFWAGVSEVDEVTRGQGQVIPSQRTQIIENLEGGLLETLLVREGQIVEKGTPVARLSNQQAESTYRDAMGKIFEHRVAIARLEALLNHAEPVIDDELLEKAPRIVEDQKRLFTMRKQQIMAELDMIESQYRQKLQDVQEQVNRRIQIEQGLALAKEQLALARSLIDKHLYSKVEFLNLQQKVVTMQGDLQALVSSIPKAESAANELLQKRELREAELHSQMAEEINKRRTEMTSLLENLSAGSDRVMRTELRSPVRGVIKQIMSNTVGGVIKPGEPIMEIVPLDDTLLVEVRIRPADIAFIYPNQRAMVKISAYDFSIYGGLVGAVEQISADTIEDRRGEHFYLAKIRTTNNSITYRNKPLPIIPGMVCTVDILTGKKTILDFLLKPILKARQDAMGER